MTIRYVDSAATGSNNGTSWANAFTTLAGADAVDAAGDIIYVKSTHSESTAGAITYAWAGTAADPTRIICVSDSNEPPTTVATGAVVATTGANNLIVSSSSGYVYFYGMTFKSGDSTNSATVASTSTGVTVFDKCTLELVGSGSSGRIGGSSSYLYFYDCDFKFASTSQGLYELATINRFLNCRIASGRSAITTLILNNAANANYRFYG